jgi:hypothetical protein
MSMLEILNHAVLRDQLGRVLVRLIVMECHRILGLVCLTGGLVQRI